MNVEKPENGPQNQDRAVGLKILAVPFLLSLNMLLTAYIAQFVKDQGFDLTKIPNWFWPKDHVPTLFKSPETTEEQVGMANGFINIKSRLEDILNTQLSLSDPSVERLSDLPNAVHFLHERGKLHLVNGVALARIALPLEEAATIFQSKDELTINGDNFSLNSPYDRSLAAAVLELKFKKVVVDHRFQVREKELEERAKRTNMSVEELRLYTGSEDDDRPKIESQLSTLRYLKSRNFDITLDENTWVFLPTDYLIYLGRTMRALEDNDLPTSVRFRFVRHKKGMPSGQYDGHDWPEPFTIKVTNRSGSRTIPHEIGHFLSDAAYLPDQYWANKMKPFSQIAFTGFVWPNLNEDPQKRKEEYAEAVERYLFAGPDFRRAVLSDQTGKQARMYKFVKQMFNGREFTSEGIPLIPREIYKPGTMVRINDPDQDRPGILLRPILSPNELEVIKPDLPAVFNDDAVELLEKQTLSGFFSRDGYIGTYDERTFWKVRVFRQGYLGEGKVVYLGRDTVGWIEEKWLGEVLQR